MSHKRLSDFVYRHFIEQVKDYAIYMLNPDGTVASWNEGAHRAKGYSSDEIVGQHYGIFYSEQDRNAGLPLRNLQLALDHGQYEGEGWRYRKDGSRFWAHVVVDPIYDDEGIHLGFAKITRDISEQKEINDKISWMARYDALTGLPNRVEFFSFVEQLLNNSEYQRIVVCTIDLDKFKDINDIEGHHVGDQLLQRVAAQTLKILGKDEMVARFGGDEFVAVKGYNSRLEARAFTSRLYACFSGLQKFATTEFTVSASMGVAVYPDDATDIKKLLSNSDLAMYRAKQATDVKICWYEKDMDEETRYRNMLAGDIRKGIKEGQFFLHYQEKRAIKDKEISGYEALLRWNHPRLGSISPDIFIPIAEESGAIVPLGYWVISTVCQEAMEKGINKKISINISPVQLRHPNFIERVRTLLQRSIYPMSLLEFEVTETAFIINKQLTFNVLHQFQKMGISIALDDFGTGYSSLSTLREFQFDVIKLDKSFLNNVEKSYEARSFVRAIISLGNSIHTPLIAEGVETVEQLRILEEEGCSEIQGFLFGKPTDIDHL